MNSGSKKTIAKVQNQNKSKSATTTPAVPVFTTPVATPVTTPALLPTPTLPNGEPMPPGVNFTPVNNEVKIIKKSFKEMNMQWFYNHCNLYGTYRIPMREFLDWFANGKQGSLFGEDKDSDIRVYAYKADDTKKFVTVNVKARDTFRAVKMFEPLSSAFLASVQDQLQSVYQNLVNIDGEETIPRMGVLPMQAIGPIRDEVYEEKKNTALFADWFSINTKDVSDGVYEHTVLAYIDRKIVEFSQLN